MIQNQDLELWAGDAETLELTLTESDGTSPLNLAGASVEWQVSTIYDLSAPIISKNSQTSADIVITDSVAGLVTIDIKGEDTLGLGGQPYFHSVRVIDVVRATSVLVLLGNVTIHKAIPSVELASS